MMLPKLLHLLPRGADEDKVILMAGFYPQWQNSMKLQSIYLKNKETIGEFALCETKSG